MNYGTRLTVDDKIRSLFQLDPVLPAQYENTFQRRFPLAPEKMLMLAVLEDAITCLQRYAGARGGKAKQFFLEAADWIMEKDTEWLFSFEQICSTFGWDPMYVRRGLTKNIGVLAADSPDGGHPPTGNEPKKCDKRKKVRLAA
jgi:hypothetical protein